MTSALPPPTHLRRTTADLTPFVADMSHISTKVLMFGVFLINDQADIGDNVTLTSVIIPS